eukprot:TRINITY_DN3345_c0_g1_i3.p1 TRINITY_DN3345_c0_g1~~TRINITY_DN3345_c0_g1_i3.p1  ORF type:complete len:191 (-),score=36.32 TRINITY_DN3345_c0_g1_i3:5-493(-)
MSSSKKKTKSKFVSNATPEEICAGFTLNGMNLKDADTGELLWKSDWESEDVFSNELEAHVPASIVECRAVSRELDFSSAEMINSFRLEQNVFLSGQPLEVWNFSFGFVIPNSRNTWQSTIVAAGDGQMIPAEVLNGNVTIVTEFFDGDTFVASNTVRVYYDL